MTDFRTAAHEAIARAHASQVRPHFGYIPDADHKRKQKDSRLRFTASPTVPSQASLADFEAPIMVQGWGPQGPSSCMGHGPSQCVYVSMGAAGPPMPWVPS